MKVQAAHETRPGLVSLLGLCMLMWLGCGCLEGRDIEDAPTPDPPPVENGGDEETGYRASGWPLPDWWGWAMYEGPEDRCRGTGDLPERSGPVEVYWERPLRSLVDDDRRMTLAGDHLFVLPVGDRLLKVDRHDGEIVWATYDFLDLASRIVKAPDGLLYLWSPQLLAVEPSDLGIEREIVAGGTEAFHTEPLVLEDGRIVVMGYWGDLRLEKPADTDDGYETVWRIQASAFRHSYDMALAVERGLIVAPIRADDGAGSLLGVELESGRVRWPSDVVPASRPLIVGNNVVVRNKDTDSDMWTLAFLSPDTGGVIDRLPYRPATLGSGVYEGLSFNTQVTISPDGGRIYIVQNRQVQRGEGPFFAEITAYDRNHDVLWRRWIPALDDDPDPEHGTTSLSYGGRVQTRPVLGDDGTIYVASQNCHVFALSPDGELVWWDRHPFPAQSGPLILSDDGILYSVSRVFRTGSHDLAYSYIRAYRLTHVGPGPHPTVECPDGVPCPIVPPE